MQKVKQDLERHLSIINDNVLISITDKKGIILDVSDAYCRLTKYNKNENISLYINRNFSLNFKE